MSQEFARLAIEIDSTQAKKGATDLDDLTKSAQRAEKGTTMLEGAWAKFAATVAAGALAKGFYDVNTEFQKLNQQIVAITGNQTAADAYFEELQKFAATTPNQLTEVTQAFVMLRSRGLSATITDLRALSDLAAARSVDILTVTEAVQSGIAGHTESLKRLGIQLVRYGDQAVVSFNGQQRTVKAGALEIQKAIEDIAAAKFGEAGALQMKTLGGAMSNLVDVIKITAAKMGDAGPSRIMVQGIHDITDSIQQAQPALVGFAASASDTFAGTVSFINNHRTAIAALGVAYVSANLAPRIIDIAGSVSKWSTAITELATKKVAVDALTGAVTTYTVEANAGLFATNALKAGVAALGGPLGLAVTLLTAGVTAWAIWGDNAKGSTTKALEGIKKVNDELERELKFQRERKRLAEAKTEDERKPDAQIEAEAEATKRLVEEQKKLSETRSKLADFRGSPLNLVALQDELEQRKLTIAAIQDELDRSKKLTAEREKDAALQAEAKKKADEQAKTEQEKQKRIVATLKAEQERHKTAEQRAKFDHEMAQLEKSRVDASAKILAFNSQELAMVETELERRRQLKALDDSMAKEEFGKRGSAESAERYKALQKAINDTAAAKQQAIVVEDQLSDAEMRRNEDEREAADLAQWNQRLIDERLDRLDRLRTTLHQNAEAQREANQQLKDLADLARNGVISLDEYDRGLLDATRQVWETKSMYTDAFGEMGDAVRKWSDDALNDVTDWAMGAQINVANAVKSILRDLTRMALQQAALKALAGSWFGGADTSGGFISAPIGAGAGDSMDWSTLGTPARLAAGGVASIAAPVAPAAARTSGPVSVSVTIDARTGESSVQASGPGLTAQDWQKVGELVALKNREVIANEQRSGGLLDPARYGRRA